MRRGSGNANSDRSGNRRLAGKAKSARIGSQTFPFDRGDLGKTLCTGQHFNAARCTKPVSTADVSMLLACVE
ncbi:MAG: hypothetical protein NVSMB22_07020 [Chloroflexota bacterium]